MRTEMAAKPWDRGARGWFVRWTDETGRRRAQRIGPAGDESAQLARDVVDRLNRAAARAELWERGSAQSLPIAELVRGWRERYAPLRSARTQITDYGLVERLATHFGVTDLRDLTHGAVTSFVAEVLREGKSGHTAANALSILRRVANLARHEGLFEGTKFEWATVIGTARRRTLEQTSSRDSWSREETAALLEAARAHTPRLYPALLAAFHTGMRRGELLALRWEDIDFATMRIHVRRAAAAGGGTKLPKAGRGRLVPISGTLAIALAAHRETQRRGKLKRRAMPEWVFASPRGRFWQERNFSRAWEELRTERFDRARVRKLPLHCTRHTFITRGLEAGVPVSVVAGWVGASVAVIEAHYAHVIPSEWSVAFLDAGSVHGTTVLPTELSASTQVVEANGDPGAIRTRDPQLRRSRDRTLDASDFALESEVAGSDDLSRSGQR